MNVSWFGDFRIGQTIHITGVQVKQFGIEICEQRVRRVFNRINPAASTNIGPLFKDQTILSNRLSRWLIKLEEIRSKKSLGNIACIVFL